MACQTGSEPRSPLSCHPLRPFPANRLPPFTRQSIWEIFQVVKRISGTFGWLCHDEPQSEWAWSQPSLIPPPFPPPVRATAYASYRISQMAHTQRAPQPIKVLKLLPLPPPPHLHLSFSFCAPHLPSLWELVHYPLELFNELLHALMTSLTGITREREREKGERERKK